MRAWLKTVWERRWKNKRTMKKQLRFHVLISLWNETPISNIFLPKINIRASHASKLQMGYKPIPDLLIWRDLISNVFLRKSSYLTWSALHGYPILFASHMQCEFTFVHSFAQFVFGIFTCEWMLHSSDLFSFLRCIEPFLCLLWMLTVVQLNNIT